MTGSNDYRVVVLSRDHDDEKERKKINSALRIREERSLSRKKKKGKTITSRTKSEEKAAETCYNEVYASV